MLVMNGITKVYPGTVALSRVDVSFRFDEVHAVIGENGAGKTTLVSILGGSNTPTEGTITVDGEAVTLGSPAAALARGIAQVSQEGSLVAHLTGAENILLGAEPATGRVIVRRVETLRRAEELRRRWFPHTAIDLTVPVETLAFADQKVIEILRALRAAARLLILDEPTATLPAREKEDLWKLIRSLPAQGVGIVLISHFLSEVLALSDRITVLRDGSKVASLERGEADEHALVGHMLQREIAAPDASGASESAARSRGEAVLRLSGWATAHAAVDDLVVHRGEILGLIGLTGAGHFECAGSMFDQTGVTAGTLRLSDGEVKRGGPRRNLRRGIAMVPDHRMINSLIAEWTVRENLSFAHVHASSVGRSGILSRPRERGEAERISTAMTVRSHSVEQRVSELSGGNKQKVSIGKWLFGRTEPYRVLVFVEPTEGVDVGAKFEIHALMRRLADGGAAIVVASSDLLEVMSVADRVVPFVSGRAAAPIEATEFSEAGFIRAISGAARAELDPAFLSPTASGSPPSGAAHPGPQPQVHPQSGAAA